MDIALNINDKFKFALRSLVEKQKQTSTLASLKARQQKKQPYHPSLQEELQSIYERKSNQVTDRKTEKRYISEPSSSF